MAKSAQSGTPDGSLRIDILSWVNKITLDIIGQAGTWRFFAIIVSLEKAPILLGFNHSFGSLHQDEPHLMTEGFRKSTTFDPFSLKFLIPVLFPPARLIVCHPRIR